MEDDKDKALPILGDFLENAPYKKKRKTLFNFKGYP